MVRETDVRALHGRSNPDARRGGRRRPPPTAAARAFALGCALGALTQVAYLVVYADIPSFLRIYFVDVPRLYRFIWPRAPIDSLGLPGFTQLSAIAIVSSLAMLGLIIDGQLPRRYLAVALVPLCGVASVIVQAKGFPYHFHPVSAGLYLQGLASCVAVRAGSLFAEKRRAAGRRAVPAGCSGSFRSVRPAG